MARGTDTLTADDLFRMPDDGFHRYELVEGQLVVMTPAGGLHGAVGMRLAIAVGAYVEEHQLGVLVSADTGFILATDPDTVRAPDIGFVSRDRIPADGIPKAFWRCAPDLAVEVLSPTDVGREVDEKIEDYLGHGVRLVWFVEPAARRVTVHRPGLPPLTLDESETLDGGDILPGFHYSLSRLFTFDV
jgi:Uma2 family endonuclease